MITLQDLKDRLFADEELKREYDKLLAELRQEEPNGRTRISIVEIEAIINQRAFDYMYANAIQEVSNSWYRRNMPIEEETYEEIEEYSNILQELINRSTPMKPELMRDDDDEEVYNPIPSIRYWYACPVCGSMIYCEGEGCPNNNCRQAIDWSDDE